MRRGAKPGKAKVEPKVPVARKSLKNQVRDLEKRLAEALDQQTATSEILRVISNSRTDVQPVFDMIAERAVKLCDAEIGVVSIINGEYLQLANHPH